ncbi:hypothetical protein CASFOL_015134 [Castilleja foliolosa]|uniref:Dof-type domain-containing protein n=1 Tax=Castilleja foliolosa TaxID=1961234 RepID=A0ABD3DGV1_9LAMI
MSEVKDPKIKLFGKTIELPETRVEAAEISEPAAQSCDAAKENSSNQIPSCSSDYSMLEDNNLNGEDAEDRDSQQSQSGWKQDDTNDENDPDHPSPPNQLKDSNAPPQEDPSEPQDKTLKKPDKIIPCPRCNSMDTKFCYFNNYNVKQPRHFCRNCQRYWTAGGTIRNVPVGAGRRKNKNILSCSQFRPLEISDTARAMNPNCTLLAFNSETTPLCESMVNIADQTIRSREMNRDDRSSGSLVSSSKDEGTGFMWGLLALPLAKRHSMSSPISPPTYVQLPFYSTAMLPYWAGPNIWNVPFIYPTPSSGLKSPTLGKHSRDENVLKQGNSLEDEETGKGIDNLEKKCLWVPKTLRIDDPGEAAKSSSIWATLGIKIDRDNGDFVSVGVGGGLFKAFRSPLKGNEKDVKVQETPLVLQANPAALSRSVSFRESS